FQELIISFNEQQNLISWLVSQQTSLQVLIQEHGLPFKLLDDIPFLQRIFHETRFCKFIDDQTTSLHFNRYSCCLKCKKGGFFLTVIHVFLHLLVIFFHGHIA